MRVKPIRLVKIRPKITLTNESTKSIFNLCDFVREKISVPRKMNVSF